MFPSVLTSVPGGEGLWQSFSFMVLPQGNSEKDSGTTALGKYLCLILVVAGSLNSPFCKDDTTVLSLLS